MTESTTGTIYKLISKALIHGEALAQSDEEKTLFRDAQGALEGATVMFAVTDRKGGASACVTNREKANAGMLEAIADNPQMAPFRILPVIVIADPREKRIKL